MMLFHVNIYDCYNYEYDTYFGKQPAACVNSSHCDDDVDD